MAIVRQRRQMPHLTLPLDHFTLHLPSQPQPTVAPSTSTSTSDARREIRTRTTRTRDTRDNWRRRVNELHATGARATREKSYCEDERFPDKNSWVHYFGKCQVKNAKHLEINLFSFGKMFRDLANSNK
jgi:hypothetical protein